MKRVLATLLILAGFAASAVAADETSGRRRFNFNPEWRVLVGDPTGAEAENYDDSDWRPVTLPYAWNEDDAFRVSIDEIATGVAWYRKTFRLPAEEAGKKVFLEFEGLRQAGTVWVNGHEMILHENGVMAFGIDVTDVVRFGGADNTIAVRTDNSWGYRERATDTSFQWNNSNFNVPYGGITKNVILHITPTVYQTLPLYSNLGTTGVYIYPTDINVGGRSATIHAESEVRNDGDTPRRVQYAVSVTDMEGRQVAAFTGRTVAVAPGETATVSASKQLTGLNFWSWGYGYLYTVVTSLREGGRTIDAVTTRTGFRKTQFGEGMIRLNDRVLQMKGYGQRTSNEWPAIGLSVPAWLSDYSNSLIVEGNGNFVRWMHVTPWKQDVESADRVGLIHVMPAGDAERDVTGRQWEQRKELMRDAIVYNRNNPSILFYECGNESISYEHMAEMKAIRDAFDPNGGRAIGSREMLDIDNAEWGGEMLYINHSAKHPMFATEYARDEALRKYWDDWSFPYHREGAGPMYRNASAADYNHNQDRFAVELIRRWFDYYEARPGTGTRVSSGGANIIFSDTNTHFRGEENYRRSGVVDPMRVAKDAFGAHRVMWDGWVDPERYHTYIVGHWNYPRATVKDIYVVSAAPRVELLLNGTPVAGGERSYEFLHTFPGVAFAPGTLKAVSYDEAGAELSSYTIETAGDPAAIRLKAMTSPNGMLADGHDLALIEVEVVDAQGRRCPLDNSVIDFAVSGPAEWRGGIAQGPDNFILSRRLPVEAGVNRVLVRSTTEAGEFTVSAASGVLEPASVTIRTTRAPSEGGLSELFAGAELPSYLDRGPTPAGASYTVSRLAIPVRATAAGANAEQAGNTYDDNELSEWANDGRLSTGWIAWELERPATLSEVCLKLTGWRMRSYPIAVYVDDQEVWRGETARSLGYVTLKFEPTLGRKVTIRLVGDSEEAEGFAGIVELDPAQELDLFRDPNADRSEGQLRIVEAEFYERVN